MSRDIFDKLTPYELGETNDIVAFDYLINYLNDIDQRVVITAIEAIGKLSKKYKDESIKTIPYLLNMLTNNNPNIRQYSLKVLFELDLSENDREVIKHIANNDIRDSNKKLANKIIPLNLLHIWFH